MTLVALLLALVAVLYVSGGYVTVIGYEKTQGELEVLGEVFLALTWFPLLVWALAVAVYLRFLKVDATSLPQRP